MEPRPGGTRAENFVHSLPGYLSRPPNPTARLGAVYLRCQAQCLAHGCHQSMLAE